MLGPTFVLGFWCVVSIFIFANACCNEETPVVLEPVGALLPTLLHFNQGCGPKAKISSERPGFVIFATQSPVMEIGAAFVIT